MKADAILGGAAALVAQGFPDSADNLLQHHRDLTDDCAPQAATHARLSVSNAQVSDVVHAIVARQRAHLSIRNVSSPRPCEAAHHMVASWGSEGG